ncbi:MAG: RICIN domain-containing protein [Candidatus Thermoplasmatota archaeon]|nr:RICIN domain-containing protein [Candidatus Thermoplasmatota archaeon]
MQKKYPYLRSFAIFAVCILVAVAFHPALNPIWSTLSAHDTTVVNSVSHTSSSYEQPLLLPSYLSQIGDGVDVDALQAATPPAHHIDTDADGLYDSVETVLGTDSNNSDSDFDRLDDYYEATHQLDPLNPDSNYDGLSDYFEVANVTEDADGDGLPNAWDCDNDGDLVNDAVDLSPYTKTDVHESIPFSVSTQGNPTYLSFQIRPKNPDNLRLPAQKWDWPDDSKGFMKDLNNTQEDMYITPMLEITTPADFTFIAQHSNKCLEVSNASLEENTTIVQHTYTQGSHQEWRILSAGFGYYQIVAKHSGKCLTVYNDSNSTISIVQADYNGDDSQLWRLEVKDTTLYYLLAKKYGQYLCVENASMGNGAAVTLENFTGALSQQWCVEPIGNTVPSASETSQYGMITELNTTLVPIAPIKENGAIVALHGKMFYSASDPLSVSADMRLLWMVNGLSDRTMRGLRVSNGRYLSMGDNGTLTANSTTLGENETFEWVDLGNHRIALLASTGKYLSVSSAPNHVLVVNSTKIDNAGTFEVVSLGGSTIALKAHNGKYVRAEGGGGGNLVANATVVGAWEKFIRIDRGFSPEIITLVRYYEDFMVTGCSIQENHGTSVGVFFSPEVNQTFKAGFVMGYKFLRSQHTLPEMPGILQDTNVTINSSINTTFSHQDKAIAALMGQMIPAAVHELHNISTDETLPLLSAVEDHFTSITLDNLTHQGTLVDTPLLFDVTESPVITLKTYKINWFNTSTVEALPEDIIFNETLDWVLARGLNETDDPSLIMINLVLAWNTGESMVTQIGDVPIGFNLPELPEVFDILTNYVWTSITALYDITESIIKHARAAFNFLKTTLKALKSILTTLKLTKFASGINKVLKAISAAQKAMNAAKATKFLSVMDKISVWLLIIDLYITAGIAWYIWFTIAIDQDWSDYGIALAFLVFYTFVLYSLVIILVGLVFPLLALIFVILDLIFDFFGDFLELVLGWFTDSYYLSDVDLISIGTPSLNVYDYDQNGMDVGDRIDITSRLKGVVKRTRGGQQDLDNSYIVPHFNLAVPPGTTWYQNCTVVSVETDHSNYRNTVYDLAAWVDPQSMVNFPMTIQLKTSYRVFYKECVWFFKWWCDRESQSGTSTTTLTTLYYDVMPGNISAFCRWNGITSLDVDGDGINNTNELSYTSNPWRYDTDGDGLWDGFEVERDMFPYLSDTDADGLGDYQEIVRGTDPTANDTDDDGITDYEEYRGWRVHIDYFGTPFSFSVFSNPLVNDSDKDGLTDLEEYMKHLNPASYDTDANGIDDVNESLLLTYGFITDVEYNGQGSSVQVLPNATIDATVYYRIPAGYHEDDNGTMNCSLIIFLYNTSVNYTITNLTSDPLNITFSSTTFQFNAPAVEDVFVMSYYVNWTGIGQVPSPENRETIGVLTVNATGGGPVQWPCYGPGEDTDGDGIINLHECIGWPITYTTATGTSTVQVTSDPKKADTDGDGLSDVWEHNCYENSTNPRESDTDDDGIPDSIELLEGINPLHYDTDGDGLDDATERQFGSNPLEGDSDVDGLSDAQEFLLTSNPNSRDTDSDGLDDLAEYLFDSSLILPDTDADTLFDVHEYNLSTNPRNPDTDGDGLLDGYEVLLLTNPKDNDTDHDGLSDYLEIQWRTDPVQQDTDDDGLGDGDEFFYGTHPTIPDTDFDGVNDSEDLDTYAAQVDHIVLAYDLGQDILEFEENLTSYTNVTKVSASQLLSDPQYYDAPYVVLIGRPDAGNDTVGNITKTILEQAGENITRILESDFYRFSLRYGVWNHTQTVVMLTHPYQADHWIVLNLLKSMRITKYGNTVIAEFPTPRDSFIVDTVQDLDTFFWVYLNCSVTPWMNITLYNRSTSPHAWTVTREESLNTYISIAVSDNVQNDTTDNVEYAWVAMYYTAADLDRTGDGDGNDIGDINENTLHFYVFDEHTTRWVSLSTALDWVYETGVETANIEIYGTLYEGYVWANVSHFSLYAPAGAKRTAGAGGGSTNRPPHADASASDRFGYIKTPVHFDGSRSADSDGTLVSYLWMFGDGATGTGVHSTHVYTAPGRYNVILQVTDNAGAVGTDTISVTILVPNNPPTPPLITGQQIGHINVPSPFTFLSSDLDNDTIRYVVDWDDGHHNTSQFVSNNTPVVLTHTWSTAGAYRITAYAEDANTVISGTGIYTVFIDVTAEVIGPLAGGYLIDTNNDGVFDVFYNETADVTTSLQHDTETTYLIDTDGDGIWDYRYDIKSHTLTPYQEPSISGVLLLALALLAVLLVLSFLIVHKKRRQKKAQQEQIEQSQAEPVKPQKNTTKKQHHTKK